MTQMSFGGDWTIQKLEILRRYLDAYTTALKNRPSPLTPFRLTYVDAFAGEGSWQQGSLYAPEDYDDFTKLLDGSARIALRIRDRPFDRLYFIEKELQRWQSLMKLSRDPEHSGRDIHPLHEDANEALPWICDQLVPSDRAVVFLDPFATQVSWTTIETLARTEKIDCWILFPVGAIARMLPISSAPPSHWQPSLDRIFGGRTYWEDFYHVSQQLSFLGEDSRQERQPGSHQIARRYRERLESAFNMVAPTERIFRNSTNSPMFELFFAASNPRGALIAVDIADHLLKNW